MLDSFIAQYYTVFSIFTNAFFGAFVNDWRTLATSIYSLILVLSFYSIMQGKGNKEEVLELVKSMLLISLVFSLFFHYDTYKAWVVKPVIDLTIGMINKVMVVGTGGSGSSSTIFASIDSAYGNLFEFASKQLSELGLFDSILALVVYFGLFIIYGLSYIEFASLIIVGIGMLFVLMSVGVIFLFFIVSKKTRFIAAGWLRSIAQTSLTLFLAGVVMGISLAFTKEAISQLSQVGNAEDVMNISMAYTYLVGYFTFKLLSKAPELASGLTGGTPSSASGGLESLKNAGVNAYAAGKTAAPHIGKAGSAVGGAARSGAVKLIDKFKS